MKKGTNRINTVLIFLLVCQLFTLVATAQAPQKISYQAAVRNSSDLLIVSQPIGMKLSILQGSSSGTVVFSETHVATTTPNGIVSVEIGTGTLVSGNFATIDWTAGPYFIKTETDPAGGTAYNITGTTQLISVPYAFYASKAGNSFTSKDYNALINKPVTDGSETKINAGTFITVTGTGTSGSPYVVNSNPVMGGFSHYLGELYNGGIIFYLYRRQDGTEHALIVNLNESTATLQNPASDTNADSFWDGAGNTAKYTNSNAKTYIDGLGYGWYLPAVDELNLLWQNRYHVNKGLAAAGGTPVGDNFYWSSTEVSTSTNLGWQFDLLSGTARNSQAKGSPEKVRGVRGMITTPTQITTTAISAIKSTSASSGGVITSDEGSPVIARGVCWSTSPNPTTADSKTSNGAGTGTFTSSITGLTLNVTYYVRAYATNGAGTAYGNERSFTTALAVGESYGGGIVAYVDGTGHGFIAAAADQGGLTAWGCDGTNIGGAGVAERTAIGGGLLNTSEIVAGCATVGIPAEVCFNLVLNGYSDWHLPDELELNELYVNRVAIGGFAVTRYWSSSEAVAPNSANWARALNFSNGVVGTYAKTDTWRVRAIRYF